jgi:hypothetical protein
MNFLAFLTRKKSAGQAGDENVSIIIKRFCVYTVETQSLSKIAILAVHAASLI